MDTKNWWNSKTIWINSLTLAVGILAVVSSQVGVDGKPLISPDLLPYLLCASAVANTVLRFLTTGAVK